MTTISRSSNMYAFERMGPLPKACFCIRTISVESCRSSECPWLISSGAACGS